eukprot:TRINITY_DN66746_c3_g1_i1.p1 TRINITY_DN66746_c3_g1~~TRINITY_DN66746_c3_g1_i1.p1  ORF type:complete len:401 (-),score=181.56 TRINITY_DN66746_c3_g1_i1:748-1950(-)
MASSSLLATQSIRDRTNEFLSLCAELQPASARGDAAASATGANAVEIGAGARQRFHRDLAQMPLLASEQPSAARGITARGGGIGLGGVNNSSSSGSGSSGGVGLSLSGSGSGSGRFGGTSLSNRSSQSTRPPSSEFARQAAESSRYLHSVAQDLEQLTRLVKQRSIFDDKATEIQTLTQRIKDDIGIINSNIDMLEQVAKMRGSAGSSSRQSRSHNHAVVDNLKVQLRDTTKSFAQILQVRSQTLQQHKKKKEQFGNSSKSISLRKRNVRSFGEDLSDDESGNGGERKTGGVSAQFEQAMMMQSDQQNQYLNSRAEAVEQIRETIGELGHIYQRLATIVSIQNEVTIRISENVDDTLDNVEMGHKELLTYFDSVSSNRWLILKIFLVLILFAIFFSVFVA